ncbi:MAG: ABC transporter permease, partial [Clostridia bacterium]|nr:ABC transporter permease [Clostridia bacterium]
IMVRDFSTDYSPISFDISQAMKDAGISSTSAQIVFEVRSTADALRYILVESVKLTGGERAKNLEELEEVSFDNATVLINNADKNSLSYWACSGRKGIHNSELFYCDYVIDTYMLVYGDADPVTYSATEFYDWVDKGWCSYDYKIGPESFVRLTDDCPIDFVDSQTVLNVTKKLSSVTARGWNYRKMGYKEMPKFILGTDASGFDLWKRAFAGLRTSLILGVCTAAFCFVFGLIWGSISGYFGGNVDLFMERFCEILSGVPWIVIMTLCILHLGNNFLTFFLALCMTGWMGTAARTRTQFYRFKGREYVLASRTLGSSDIRLIFKHILPNSMGTIITSSVLTIPSVIFSEATLAYLNLGLQGLQSFGVMMSTNQQYLGIYPNLVIFPAVIIALMMISFNLFGNGLRDAFNPSLKGSE